VAAGRITGGRMTLYRTSEDGSTVPLPQDEVDALVEESRARRRRLFTGPPAPTRLAQLLGHGVPEDRDDPAPAAGPHTQT
jgi:hypothetical protein